MSNFIFEIYSIFSTTYSFFYNKFFNGIFVILPKKDTKINSLAYKYDEILLII
jgi:hypothetical protein